ncbi:cofactor-independent phosphoglycerate mutase [Defluviitalea phaphyphila]|uniref:cofactor-independent phosphoglycerate mutase n=1 Tax=Defluviitalea phaphyphila TaxID=1473580 RepID=UPI000730BCF8|nr:cofactor-independent phosphoglycerate mutase [Defluviitalea phaphyphila]
MKYVIILGDGMADEPIEELGNKTPLQYAKTNTIDYLAKYGEVGKVNTIPKGMKPGSDTANLSVLGYDPKLYYTGRSPLEAVSMGVPLLDSDITFRCNLVTLSKEGEYEEKIILDHSADEISTEEANELIKTINEHFKSDIIEFHSGISYRHLMVWHEGSDEFDLTPPHDILGKRIKDYLPKGDKKDIIYDMMKKSYKILSTHPINLERIKKGLKPANSIWIWGEGRKPRLPLFKEKYGLKGSVISAVDLIKGIGICAGLRSIDVEGATGNINTNFIGKAMAAVNELKKGQDFVYVHIEAPDECGHRNELYNKIKSIELIDEKVIKVIKEQLDLLGEDYKIMVLPDHPTPIRLRTHTSDPVPYVIYQKSKEKLQENQKYDEIYIRENENYFPKGHELMDYFLK